MLGRIREGGDAPGRHPPDYTYTQDASNGSQGRPSAARSTRAARTRATSWGTSSSATTRPRFIKRLEVNAQGQVTGTVPFATGAPHVDLELGPEQRALLRRLRRWQSGTGR